MLTCRCCRGKRSPNAYPCKIEVQDGSDLAWIQPLCRLCRQALAPPHTKVKTYRATPGQCQEHLDRLYELRERYLEHGSADDPAGRQLARRIAEACQMVKRATGGATHV